MQDDKYAVISKETSVRFHVNLQHAGNTTYQSQNPISNDYSYASWLLAKSSPLTQNINSFLFATAEFGIYQKVIFYKTQPTVYNNKNIFVRFRRMTAGQSNVKESKTSNPRHQLLVSNI